MFTTVHTTPGDNDLQHANGVEGTRRNTRATTRTTFRDHHGLIPLRDDGVVCASGLAGTALVAEVERDTGLEIDGGQLALNRIVATHVGALSATGAFRFVE